MADLLKRIARRGKKIIDPLRDYDPYRPRRYLTDKQREQIDDLERRDAILARLTDGKRK